MMLVTEERTDSFTPPPPQEKNLETQYWQIVTFRKDYIMYVLLQSLCSVMLTHDVRTMNCMFRYSYVQYCTVLRKRCNYMFLVQGGAMNRGLLFAGPPLPPLGGCERKDWRIPLGGRPSDTLHRGRWWAAVSYGVISLAASSSLKALRGIDPSWRSVRPPAPVGASLLR